MIWKDGLQGAKAACLGVEDSALIDPKASVREERIRMLRDMAIVDGEELLCVALVGLSSRRMNVR